MKKFLLFCMVAVLFASCEKSEKKENNASKEKTKCSFEIKEGTMLPIAVVNLDTVLNNYKLVIEENERLTKKEEDILSDLNQKVNKLQKEFMEFQDKLEHNAFISLERAESEKQRLMQKQQDLQTYDQEKAHEISYERQQVELRVQDSINNVINILNNEWHYHLIITTNSLNNNVLFNAPEYDVTLDVLNLLNERYKK